MSTCDVREIYGQCSTAAHLSQDVLHEQLCFALHDGGSDGTFPHWKVYQLGLCANDDGLIKEKAERVEVQRQRQHNPTGVSVTGGNGQPDLGDSGARRGKFGGVHVE